MPQKTPEKKIANTKGLRFQQVINVSPQQSQTPNSNQRVLILSTPIKLKDGTVNIEQRAIPLRINNNQLIMSGGAKSNVISLKRSNEPPPLALPIDQLNKKSPTFVKNEVGQVMGKLIPLGKFSNISPNTLSPVTPVSASPVLTNQKVKGDTTKQHAKPRENKALKLTECTRKYIRISNESLTPRQNVKFKERPLILNAADAVAGCQNTKSSVPGTSSIEVSLVNKQSTPTSTKPKKEIHLVLKRENNTASIGQTGTNIKLIPFDQWKQSSKLSVLKSPDNMSSQTKTISIESRMNDQKAVKTHALRFAESHLQSSIKDKSFSKTDILSKDSLNIESVRTMNNIIKSEPVDQHELSTKDGTKVPTDIMDVSIPDFALSDFIESNDTSNLINLKIQSKPIRLKKDESNIGTHWLRQKSEPQSQNDCKNSYALSLRNSSACSPNQTSGSSKEVPSETPVAKKQNTWDDLYNRFKIKKADVTEKELAMMSYIHGLRKRLSYSQHCKIKMQTFLLQQQRRGMAYLTGIQRSFIKSQIRNSGKSLKKQKFTKLETSVAQEILRAVGPRGYNNLRKLFYLPTRSIITNN
ncbi:uncharacterized protein LOC111673844 [Orussus abietinus]|uniref:uncharacterized protein LOC111673844 n=1 Tax=Orussus abietinus TaxID=222816 RepID=UPI0006258B41|nr:uncharacterized protein LOC111673844 [Orussus abietinus]XP_012274888.1 uncharacterized protein LOC111673844 [Orussus abietinus]